MLIRLLILISVLFTSSAFADEDKRFEITEENEVGSFLMKPGKTFREWNPSLTDNQVISQACCKQCSTGKACGNSCISRAKSCHKGSGCACD